MPGRPKTHPDTTPQHENRLSAKALDLLRRVVNGKDVYPDNEPENIVNALLVRGLVDTGDWTGQLLPSHAGRALIDKIGGKAK